MFISVCKINALRSSPLRLAASALASGGPGSLVAALRAAGLAESVSATVSVGPAHAEMRVSFSLLAGVLKHSAIQLIGTALFVWIRWVDKSFRKRNLLPVATSESRATLSPTNDAFQNVNT